MNIKKDIDLFLHAGVLLALIANIGLLFSLNSSSSGEVKAKDVDLKLTLITTEDCSDCFDTDPLRQFLSSNGITEKNINSVDYKSEEGKDLIEEYGLTRVPSAVVFGDVEEYDFMNELIDSIGEVKEGDFILTELQPPFIELPEERKRGGFEVIYLADSSCDECYDVKMHEEVFERMVMSPSASRDLDVSDDEGVTLIEEYGIIVVPTIIMRGDLASYPHLNNIWSSVGTIEDDGAYVLRRGVESMGVYKDLLSGEIITPPES